jgi:hypothetical protein
MERFTTAFEGVDDFKDPAAVLALRERLASLIAEAAQAKVKKEEVKGLAGGPLAVGGGGPAIAAALAAPRGVALTATYSAAAARISGFQPGLAGPEEKMVGGIAAIDKKAEKMLTKADGVTEKVEELVGVVGQFLAGWVVP